MKTEIRKITKEVAEVLLEDNVGNRRVSRANVEFLKEQIKQGRFRQNGDTIRISKSGRLLDGQHRLIAIKETGIALDLLVAYDLQDDVFSTIDTGRNRTAGDVLSANSIGGNNDIAAAIRLILTLFHEKRIVIEGTCTRIKHSNSEVVEFYTKNKTHIDFIYERLCLLKPKDKIRAITKAQQLALVYVLESINGEYAFSFVREIVTGNQENQGNLAIKVREYIVSSRLKKVLISPELLASLSSQYYPRYCKGENNDNYLRLNNTSTLRALIKY